MSLNIVDVSDAALNRRLYLDRLENAPAFMVTEAYLGEVCPHWRRPAAIRRAIRQYRRAENCVTLLPSSIGKWMAPFAPRSFRPWLLSSAHAHAAYEGVIAKALGACGMDLVMPPSVFLSDGDFHRAAKRFIFNEGIEMPMERLRTLVNHSCPEIIACSSVAEATEPARAVSWQQTLFQSVHYCVR